MAQGNESFLIRELPAKRDNGKKNLTIRNTANSKEYRHWFNEGVMPDDVALLRLNE